MASAEKKSSILMGFGAFFVVIGAVLVIFWPVLFFAQLKKMMILTPISMSFSLWRETPIPMFLECFFFNITNVDEILNGKARKLQVQELGPYVYKEAHKKVNLSWHDNGTVTYHNERFWYFMPDMSNGSLSDEVTSINPVIVTLAYQRRFHNMIYNLPVDAVIRMVHNNMFLTANVSSWLFDGIDDPIIDFAERLGIPVPYDKIGWFYTRNGSIEFDGTFLLNTGMYDFSLLGNIEKWKYSNRTLYRDECGVVKGSSGELWAPEFGQEDVDIFAPDICTYLTLHYDKPVTVDGIEGVQYAANESVFDNGHKYPAMACYCEEPRDWNCVPAGALNVSACRFGSPAFVSLPHFLHADPHYPSRIAGLAPSQSHNFKLALEMYTGMPLSATAQLQINLLVRYVGGLSINNRLPDDDTLVPMFWFRQEVLITPEYSRMAKFALNLRYMAPYGFYGLTAVGTVLLVAGIIILVRKLIKSPDNQPVLQEESTSEENRE